MLQMVRKIFGVVFISMILCGCDRYDFKGFLFPTSDIVDSCFEQSLAMNESGPAASIKAEESYMFYVSTDAHLSDNTGNMLTFATALRNDADASFGVMLGDCTGRRGSLPVYVEAIKHIPEQQKYPTEIFTLIGNHDLYFSGWDDFKKQIGPSVYWFEVDYGHGKDLFICLDSASGTLGNRQMEWLKDFLAKKRSRYRHCIILTHTNILYTDNSQVSSGNLPMEETMTLLELFGKHDISLCLQGHDHFRDDITFKGVRYMVVGTIRNESPDPEYLSVRLSDEEVVATFCPLVSGL